jgi:hypothetical protein
MKIFEVTRSSRRIIKRLQSLFISYSLGKTDFTVLVNTLSQITGDSDVRREIEIINAKLKQEIVDILSKENK